MLKPLLFIAISTVNFFVTAQATIDIGFDPRQSNEFKTLDDAATRYYSSQILQEWAAMSKSVFGSSNAPAGRPFFWTDEMGSLHGLESIKIVEFIRFQSLDGKSTGFILFGVRKYDPKLKKNERYFVDFWFQKNGNWWVLPKLLVFDKSHNIPDPAVLGNSVFISEVDFLDKLRNLAAREALGEQEDAARKTIMKDSFSRELLKKSDAQAQ